MIMSIYVSVYIYTNLMIIIDIITVEIRGAVVWKSHHLLISYFKMSFLLFDL